MDTIALSDSIAIPLMNVTKISQSNEKIKYVIQKVYSTPSENL